VVVEVKNKGRAKRGRRTATAMRGPWVLRDIRHPWRGACEQPVINLQPATELN
jgi:hypothetical protein